jgi:putative transposase
MNKVIKTYQIRIFPTEEQIKSIKELSLIRNQLWNDLIDMQHTEYKDNKKVRHNYSLDKEITILRKTTNLSKLNSKACQTISREVYTSYISFFQLVKNDKNARPPNKIEFIDSFHTIVYNQSGWSFKDDETIIINKIKLRFKSHLTDINKLNIKELRLKNVNGKWLCDLSIEEKIEYPGIITQNNKILSIDLGLKTLGTCIDNKGNQIVILNKSKKISTYYLKQIAKVQSKLSKKNKGSRKYKKLKRTQNKLYNKKNKQIKQTLHTQSKKLMSMNYKTIVIGDLSVKKIMKTDNNKYSKVSKSFHKSNISMFVDMLKYKSYYYKTDIVKINEAYTTQTNCLTGKLFDPKIELSDRTVPISEGVKLDRDLNATINILNRYYKNHLAVMTQPLDLSEVIQNYNLLNKPSFLRKPYLL